MLIQNAGNLAPASTPVRLPGNGEPGSVVLRPNPGAAAEAEGTRVAAKQPAVQQPTDAQLAKEVNKINATLQQTNRNLELSFSVDKATNRQVIKLLDKTTGETVVQIPSEAVLAISQGIDEFQHGLLLKQKA
jgi:flagellar protein FlaG